MLLDDGSVAFVFAAPLSSKSERMEEMHEYWTFQ
jgi:hypothetical protein